MKRDRGIHGNRDVHNNRSKGLNRGRRGGRAAFAIRWVVYGMTREEAVRAWWKQGGWAGRLGFTPI